MAKKNEVTLSMIAEEMNLDPKTVRAILRRKGHERPGTRWVWPQNEKTVVKAMIREGQRKPAAAKPAAKKPARRHVDEVRATAH
jgi:hypothetical protein